MLVLREDVKVEPSFRLRAASISKQSALGERGIVWIAWGHMKLNPFVCVGDLPFTVTAADVRQRLGRPRSEALNRVGLTEMDYRQAVFRFQQSGRLEEVTSRVSVLHLPEAAVPFASLAAFVREHDATAFRVGGFFVTPRFGVAFDPADSNWVTALAAHCLPQWRMLGGLEPK
jgi:hypothetical protein